VSVCVGAP